MLNILAFIITVLCLMYLSNEKLKESKNGKKIVGGTELGFMWFIYWRYDSSFRTDIKSARRLFGYCSLISAALFMLLEKLGLAGNFYLALVFLFSFFIWGALEWATHPLRETLKMIRPLLFILLVPFALYLLSLGNSESLDSYSLFKNMFNLFGISLTSNFDLALYFTLFIFLVILGICLIWLFLNSIIISLFLSISWLTAKISKVLVDKKSSHSLTVFSIMIATDLFVIIYNLL